MSKFICKISDVFQLKDRLVIQLDMLHDDFSPLYESGQTLELHRQDGTIISTQSWTEWFFPTNLGKPACVSVQGHVSKSDIPIGTEVWIAQRADQSKPSQRRHTA
jgi:hypothetical protein